jgi:tetratricopeptide (TPR) repeat protein
MKRVSILGLLVVTVLQAGAQSSSRTEDSVLINLYQTQRFAEAADLLKKDHPEPVTDVKTLSGLAYASQMAGRLPDAERYYQRIYQQDTTNKAVLFSLGAIEARRGDNVKALLYYQKIVKTDSNNFNVYKQMASLAQNMGDVVSTKNYLQKANYINPVEADAAFDLASIYIQTLAYSKADSIIEPALKADTGNMLLWFGKTHVDYHFKKYYEAVSDCNKLISNGNQTSMVVNMLGISYFELKQFKDCINTFARTEETQTATETMFYYMAMSYKAIGEQEKAIEYLKKTIGQAVSPNANAYYSEIGDSFETLKRYNEAIKYFEKSMFFGVIPLTYYELANIYDKKLKNRAKARFWFKKYIHSAPPPSQSAYLNYAMLWLKASRS